MPFRTIKKHQKHGNITLTSKNTKQVIKLVKGNNDKIRLILGKTNKKHRKQNKSLNEINFNSLKEKSFDRRQIKE
jgi:hypothetical protein